MKKSFVLYKDSYDYLKELSDSDFGILMKFVFEYAISKKEMPKTHALYLAFAPIKLQLDRDEEKYKNTSETNRINGSKGGKRKVANATKRKRPQTNLADNDNDSDSDTDTDSDNVNDIDSVIIGECLPSVLPILMNWLEYKRQKKDKYTSTGLKTLVKKFNSLAHDYSGLESLVENSIINNYQGIIWDKYVPSKPVPKILQEFPAETEEQKLRRLNREALSR